jgi:CheY-like chemotaxis protein
MTDKHILLVEDNPDEVVLTRRAFDRCHMCDKLVVVGNGRDALDFLFCRGEYADRDPNERPSLVLLDLNLPIVSGIEVLKVMRTAKITREIPVVVLTSSAEERDQIESFTFGANEYVRKPTGFSQFVGVLEEIRSKWLDSKNSTVEA